MTLASHIHICADAESLAQYACKWLVQRYQEFASQANDDGSRRFRVALSGGSTPKRLYQLLSELPAGTMDWQDVILIWGDERNVPPDHADSNFRMVREQLLDHIDIPAENVLGVPEPGGDAASAAAAYEKLLMPLAGDEGLPVIDCVLLGIGDDVHTASLFPETKALDITDRLVVENWVEKLDTWRITLTSPVINAAKHVAFLIAGAGKESALKTIWHGPHNPSLYPSQLVQPRPGDLWFLVDEAAVGSTDAPDGVAFQRVS